MPYSLYGNVELKAENDEKRLCDKWKVLRSSSGSSVYNDSYIACGFLQEGGRADADRTDPSLFPFAEPSGPQIGGRGGAGYK
jgi:hypothetical protein